MDQRFRIFSDYTGRWISIIIFILVIAMPMIGHIGGYFDQAYISTTEKRVPSVWPDNSLIRSDFKKYASSVESYLNDHFGFRERLVRLNSLIRLKFGISSSDKVTIGKDGWLFYSAENILGEYRGTQNFSEDAMDSWMEAEISRHKWLAERNILYTVAFFPEKSSVYPEYLPDWAKKKVAPSRIEQITPRLEDSGICFVDVTPSVIDAKKTDPVFYKTDSHWNFHGGFAGYTALIQILKKQFPELKPLTRDDLELGYKESNNQDLTQILNLTGYLRDSNADSCILKKPSHVISVESLNKDDALPVVVKTDLGNAPRVLIMRDSFTDLLIPYLNETFNEILYLPHGDHSFNEELILKFKPDIVISAMVERGLKYPSHGPAPVDTPYIIEWGPKEIVSGETFYLRTDGQPAVWVKSKNINQTTVIIWDGVELKTDRDLANGVVAASIPESLIQHKGAIKLAIKNNDNGKISREFKVKVN